MLNALKSIKNERAYIERNRVVLGSMIESAKMADSFNDYDDTFFEGVTEEEIEELIDRIPESDDEDEQVERILRAKEDIDIDGVLGIDENN